MHVFTMTKYVLHFIDETLCNYIGKYMRDMIYDFCHLPSECFEDFLSHIGSVNQGMGTNYKLVFPLKKYIKDVDVLSKKCLVSHIYRNSITTICFLHFRILKKSIQILFCFIDCFLI